MLLLLGIAVLVSGWVVVYCVRMLFAFGVMDSSFFYAFPVFVLCAFAAVYMVRRRKSLWFG